MKRGYFFILTAVVVLACGSSDDSGDTGAAGTGASGGPGGTAGEADSGAGGDSGTGGSAGSGTGGTTEGYPACETNCDKTTALHCSNDPNWEGCVEVCNESITVIPWCATLAQAAVDCSSSVDASKFECHPELNQAQVADDSCKSEIDALMSCYYDGPSGGLPDMSADCSVYCANLSGLDCADVEDCQSLCMKVTTEGFGENRGCPGANAGLIHCIAEKTSPGDFECVDGHLQAVTDACAAADDIQRACAIDYCVEFSTDPICEN